MPRLVAAGPVDLRQFDVAHVDSMVAAMQASMRELRPWFPWAQTVPTRAEQMARARSASDAFTAARDFEYSIFEPGNDELVGGLRGNPLADEHMAELGYWIRSDRHRRGYATHAVRAAATAVFANLTDIDEVQVRTDQQNRSSAGVARSAGFVLIGKVDRPAVAPAHTGRALVWAVTRAT